MSRFPLYVLCLCVLILLASSARAEQADGAFSATADTYIAEGLSIPRDSADSMWVGRNLDLGYQLQESLLKFTIPAIGDGSIIELNARLELTLGGTTTNDVPLSIQAVLIDAAWPEAITWRGRDQLNINEEARSPAVLVGSNSDLERPIVFDVTELVTAWLNEPENVNSIGILLRSTEDIVGQRERAFWSKDCGNKCDPSKHPKLVLTYKTLDADVTLASQQATQPAYLEDVPFSVTVTNTGEANLENVKAIVTKPEGTNWSLGDSGVFTWTIDSLVQGNSRSLDYTVRPVQSTGSGSGVIRHLPVTVTADDVTTPFTSNDLEDIGFINLGIQALLSIAEAQRVSTTVDINGTPSITSTLNITYTVTISNYGDNALQNVNVLAHLPENSRKPRGTIPIPPTVDSGIATWRIDVIESDAPQPVVVEYAVTVDPGEIVTQQPITLTGKYTSADEAVKGHTYMIVSNGLTYYHPDSVKIVLLPIAAE